MQRFSSYVNVISSGRTDLVDAVMSNSKAMSRAPVHSLLWAAYHNANTVVKLLSLYVAVIL